VIVFLESYSAAKEWCAIRGMEEQSKPNTANDVAPIVMADILSRAALAVKQGWALSRHWVYGECQRRVEPAFAGC
jgi:hypothetical protein